MIQTNSHCPHCDDTLVLADVYGLWTATCPTCLDPEGDSPYERVQGRGETPEDALEHYWQLLEERDLEPRYVPATLEGFIVPCSPEGYALVCDCPWRTVVFSSLTVAEAYAARPYPTSVVLPLHYGPIAAVAQKAANDHEPTQGETPAAALG